MRIDVDEVLIAADDLMRRLSEWDVLNLPAGSHDDGPYWQKEITRIRELIAHVRAD